MENPTAPAVNHDEASARVSARFAASWLRYYVAAKLRTDLIFRVAYELLHDSAEPVLDVGCGVGVLPLYLRQRGFRPAITGLDVDGRKIKRARAATAQDSLDFHEHDVVGELPAFRGNVALFDLLHYLHPAAQCALLPELAARVAPGAFLLLRDCPRDHSARFWATYAGEVFAQTISWNISRPLHFPTRDSINAAFRETEFSREERPMYGRGPFNNRLFIFRRRM